jgi:hypothetical protein
VLQLEYGQYTDDFARASSYYVNPESGKLMFNYRDDEAPLTDQVSELKTALAELTMMIAAAQQA